MTILVAPLNWGLGHASRCVPLVHRFLDEGHEVILGGDGESLVLLRRHFPKLRYVYLAPLTLRYSSGKSQVWAMLKALPSLVCWAIKDHTILKAVLNEEHIDRVVSDNRFGLYNKHVECIYMTHQLHILLPKTFKWAEGIAERLHAWVYRHYDRVWVPDYEEMDKSLAGELSHPIKLRVKKLKMDYIGPLSRFSDFSVSCFSSSYDVVAVLSGLEPQRSLLETELKHRYAGSNERVLLVQGLMNKPNTCFKRGNMTIVPYIKDEELVNAICGAKHLIARSGYSTIMDMDALGMLQKVELIPTSGQPEQEYLAILHSKK